MRLWSGRVCLCLFLVQAFSLSSGASNKTKSRIEDLFIWRVSDTLGLSPDIESKFSAEFKKLSERKSQLANEIEDLVRELESQKDAKIIEARLKVYKTKVAEQGQISIQEVESFEKLFGKSKFAQYLVLKRDLTQKLKDFISSPSKSESGLTEKLHDPKIIQDESH